MTCDWMFLCERFERNPNGGGSDAINIFAAFRVETIPQQLTPFVVAFRAHGTPHERGSWTMQVVDEKDRVAWERADRPLDLGALGVADAHVTLADVEILAIGTLRFRLFLDGVEAASVALPIDRVTVM